MFTELAPGVYSIATRFVAGTNGVIVGERGAVAVDVGYYADEGDATAEFIRKLGHKPDRVVLTHGHSDHVLGGAAFQGAEVYGHVKTAPEMRRQLKGFAERKELVEADLLAQALWPTVTYTDELFLDLGNRQVHLFPAPGHSLDHVAVYLPEDRVLFAGDNVVTAIVPAIGDGDSHLLEATLHKLLALDAEIVVAGHGEPLIGAETVREWLNWTIGYLTRIRAVVRGVLENGASLDEITDVVSFDQFVGGRFPHDQHFMLRRHRDTTMKITAEEAALLNLPVNRP